MRRPPTIRELLRDPVYRTYVKKTPVMPAHHMFPWQVWGLTTAKGTWKTKRYPTYREALDQMIAMLKAPGTTGHKFADVAITSLPVFYAPPAKLQWSPFLDWCSRCRRPTSFSSYDDETTHHALRHRIALTEDLPHRCVYCGIRKVAMPSYSGL